jgi:hypothetical protein
MTRTSTSAGLAALLLSLAAVPLHAQELRFALLDADLVTVARQLGKQSFDDNVDLHKVQVIQTLRSGGGTIPATVTVLDWPNLSLHNRPQPRQSRLYCLHDATRDAQRLGLPADQGPYYRMNGRAGSNPLVGQDLTRDPIARFAQLIADGEAGHAPLVTATALLATAIGDDATTRLEAARHLAEQPLLAARITPLQWSDVLSRTSAETADAEYKVALAELCVGQRLPGLVEALIVGLDTMHNAEYARAVGRLCSVLLGEDAAEPLLKRLASNADGNTRKAMLLALGATRVPKALEALLQWKQLDSNDAAINAALKEHGGKVAREAAEPKPDAKDDGQKPDVKKHEAKPDSGGK